jgi:hypothetical protein
MPTPWPAKPRTLKTVSELEDFCGDESIERNFVRHKFCFVHWGVHATRVSTKKPNCCDTTPSLLIFSIFVVIIRILISRIDRFSVLYQYTVCFCMEGECLLVWYYGVEITTQPMSPGMVIQFLGVAFGMDRCHTHDVPTLRLAWVRACLWTCNVVCTTCVYRPAFCSEHYW